MSSAHSFDFEAAVGAPFRMQPGLRRLAAGARQLTPSAPGSRHMREKLAVLSAYPAQALLSKDGLDAGPALAALVAHAAAEHPDWLRHAGQRVEAPALGVAVDGDQVVDLAPGRFGLGDELGRCLRSLPAGWRLAGLLCLAFEEDFALVDATDASIPWLAVCLPSHWAPEHKVGRHFAAVHAPVADNALLLQASEALTRMVSGPQRWERFVWNVTDHPRLHAHPQRMNPQRWEHTGPGWPDDAAGAWWRTERQTFIPVAPALAGSTSTDSDQRDGAMQSVFTIHVRVEPLATAIDSPDKAARLHAAISSMSPAVLDYRSLTAVREPLLRWLAERA